MNKQDFEELKGKFEKETTEKKFSKFLNYFSLGITITTVLASIIVAFTSDIISNSDNGDNIKEKIEKLELELQKQKVLNSKLQQNRVVAIDTSDYGDDLYKLKNQIENLNNIILENPEKALSVPILKIEMKNQKEQNDKDIQSIKDDVTRIYDMNKWIIGLVFTMLVSLIALNLSNLYSKKQKE